jgi:helicase
MNFSELDLPDFFKNHYQIFSSLTPIQEKSVKSGLLNHNSLLICAPTASGKTLVASMAIVKCLNEKHKAIYLVPLKALANEKFKEYQKLLEKTDYKTVISTGDLDSESGYLVNYNLLIMTTEKLDSLLRRKVKWLSEVKCLVVDEIHLLNDSSRGPTLEIILTLLKQLVKPQIVGLSATIGNPQELANWLEAELVIDNWRPVELKQGIFYKGKTQFYKEDR